MEKKIRTVSKIVVLLLLSVFSHSAMAGVIPEGKCAFTVASRKTLPEIQKYISYNLHYSHLPYVRVALTRNGWYAISVGDVPIGDFDQIKRRLLRAKEVPEDSFCSNGSAYVKIIDKESYLAISNDGGQRQYTAVKKVNCQNYNEEMAACYALTLGPKVCSQYVSEKRLPGADTFSERLAISSSCTALTNASFAKSFLPNDLVGVFIDETLEAGCEKIESENILAQLFVGIPFCVSNAARWAQKIDASNACAQEVQRACR